MKTSFHSQDLLDLVEKGFSEQDDETRVKENKKKDTKVLYLIQQTLHHHILSLIATANTSKEAWGII